MLPSKREIKRLRLSTHRRFRKSDSPEDRGKLIQGPCGYGWVYIPESWDVDDYEDEDDDEPEFPDEL